MPLATNVLLILVQPLKLAVSPHFEMNTSIPGNMTTVKHMGIISDDCNDFN
jgi:hypothetical protein